LIENQWMLHGACRNEDPELFFPAGEGPAYAEQITEAKLVCRICPVVLSCYAHILAHPAEFGIWAGLTESERTHLRTELTRKRCTGCGETKSLADYYSRPAANGGARSRCKQCENRGRAAAREHATPGGVAV
jgi:WhiB family transcriptional regulator, redox-sensing transcriptional regulator